MFRGRAAERWNHTSEVLAMYANIHRDQKKHPSAYEPSQFHPYAPRRTHGLPVTPETIDTLKCLLPS